MNAIIRYVSDMLPFMLAVLPIYVIVRALVLRKAAFGLRREVALLIFVLFLAGLASQTLLPTVRFSGGNVHVIMDGVHSTNLIPFRVVVDTYIEVSRGNTTALIINFLGNVVMFVPIGFFVPLLWNVSARRAIIIGFLSSLLVELTQLLLPRSTDVDDLLLNTLGAALGVLLYRLFSRIFPLLTAKLRK